MFFELADGTGINPQPNYQPNSPPKSSSNCPLWIRTSFENVHKWRPMIFDDFWSPLPIMFNDIYCVVNIAFFLNSFSFLGDSAKKQSLIFEAVDYGLKAIEIDELNSEAHKWYATYCYFLDFLDPIFQLEFWLEFQRKAKIIWWVSCISNQIFD